MITVTIESLAKQAASRCPATADDSDYAHCLSNAVWEQVCGLSQNDFDALADLSLDADGAPANGSRAQYLYPDFADCTILGEFDNLEAAQDLMQKIYNAAE